jgi:ATP-binding cassette, subfamily C (CFTR/MRP), member 1
MRFCQLTRADCLGIQALVISVAGPAVTITTFTVISAVGGSVELSAANAFSSIAVLALIGTPLITLFQSLPLIKSAVASLARIQDFLNEPCHIDPRRNSLSLDCLVKTPNQGDSGDSEVAAVELESIKVSTKEKDVKALVTVSDASIKWAGMDETVLKDISIKIPEGSLTMIIGPVGCGKSTLLKAILGEARVTDGVINVSSRGLAYCEQSPWLTFGTIRENITGMTDFPFDEAWYRTILDACALEKDLEQLPDADHTMIGSKGIQLSGGQRQRLVC